MCLATCLQEYARQLDSDEQFSDEQGTCAGEDAGHSLIHQGTGEDTCAACICKYLQVRR